MKNSKLFSRVPIDVPNRSGFDMSHTNVGTGKTGTLYPVLVDEILPNDTVSLGCNFQVQLPPMATDFYGRVDYVLEAFFVPMRLLWGGWESFMTHSTAQPQYPDGTPVEGKSRFSPELVVTADTDIYNRVLARGTLADYLGYKGLPDNPVESITLNALPFIAYHRIWDDWYRDSRVQAPLFYRPDPDSAINNNSGIGVNPQYLPYLTGGYNSPLRVNARATFDDHAVWELRQRNFGKDYFTSSSYLPQAGSAASTVEMDVISNKATLSVAALRSANSLQKWMERNNIAGYKYSDQIYAQFGIYPSDAVMDRCIYLGRKVQSVYTRSVYQTSPAAASGSDRNRYSSVGSKYGSTQAIGDGSLVDGFRATEHGYLFVMASLVPQAYYSTGVRRYLTQRFRVGDYAFPLLAGSGDQAIKNSELVPVTAAKEGDFAYTDRYAEYKYMDDEVHGLLTDGSSLESYALQRSFSPTSVPVLGSEFLQIPEDFLDQVFAVSQANTGFSHWYDIYFPYKKVSTLPEYSLPTLADLKHVHREYMSRGGKRL